MGAIMLLEFGVVCIGALAVLGVECIGTWADMDLDGGVGIGDGEGEDAATCLGATGRMVGWFLAT